jgi:membrane-bound metal-dependent hydrolase YbcI (DUF457 family)
MGDLFTHLVAARVPATLLRDRRLQALLIIGTFLPDVAGKGLFFVLRNRESSALATHSILGVMLVSYLACLFVEEALRRPAFLVMAIGGAIHVLVDLTKYNMGLGAEQLFLPFSTHSTEFGWIDSEDIVLLLPVDAAILAVLLIVERRRRRVQQ